MVVCVFLSMMLFYGFLYFCYLKYGLLNSYSAYATKWLADVKLSNTDVWGVLTFLVAFFMIPPMITVGEGNGWQFLGFFCPLYLMMVGLTPEWESKPLQRKLHSTFAITCALLCAAWIALVCHRWYIILAFAALFLAVGLRLKRMNAIVLWGELAIFSSAYVTLFLAL